jgi:Na+/proline symporter
MMPPIPDILLFALVPLLSLAVAIHFATQRRQKNDARTPGGFAVGASIAATLAAVIFVVLPGEAYYLGLHSIVPAVLVWLLLPLLSWNILPGMVGPTLGSPLTYVEHRFGQRVSLTAGVVYLLGRVVLSSVVLAALARMLAQGLGDFPAMPVVFAIGVYGTLCGACCGRRGGMWLGVLLAAFLAIGVPFAIATVIKLDGGPDKIWEIGQAAQRTWIGDPSLDASSSGVTWSLLPFAWTALLVMLLGDEASAARLAQLRSAEAVRFALITLLVAATFFAIAGSYVGLGMFVFYREHPREVRPKWVTNVEPETRLSRTIPSTQSPILDPATGKPKISLLSEGYQYDQASGTPILPWDEADVRPETLDRLIDQERLFSRNSPHPVRSKAELLDETGERIDPTKLATYSLATKDHPSEMLLHHRATEELWPYFVSTQAPVGMRGLLLAGLLAAALAAVDMTGLVGVASLKALLPIRTSGSERVLAALASLAVTLLAMLWVFLIAYPSHVALYAMACSLTPLAGVVMVGLTSRRATSGVALATLVAGVLAGIVLSLGLNADVRTRIHPMWSVTATFLVTLVLGHLLALVFGQSRHRGQLQGLVLGAVPIGALREPEVSSTIEIPDPPAESGRRK